MAQKKLLNPPRILSVLALSADLRVEVHPLKVIERSKKKLAQAKSQNPITWLILTAAFILSLSILSATTATANAPTPSSLAPNNRISDSNGAFSIAQKDTKNRKKKRTPSSVKSEIKTVAPTSTTSPSTTQRYLTLGIFSNIIILGIYFFWARLRQEHTAPPVFAEIPTTKRSRFNMKPIKLKRNQGIDPLTVRGDAASMIQPIGKFKVNEGFGARNGSAASHDADPDQEDISDDDTVAFGNEDMEVDSKKQFPAAAPVEAAAGPMLTSSAFKIKNLKTTADMINKRPVLGAPLANALFPPEIALHYQSKPGEKLALTCDFKSPLYSAGTLLITNKRLMAVYQRHVFKLFLPQISVENRRNSVRLRQIEDVAVTGSNRPLLLGVGALVAWIPIVGVVISGVCVAGFFFWTRPELAIRMDTHIIRTYPLRPSDMGRALHLIDRARQQLSLRKSKLPLGPPLNPQANDLMDLTS